MVFLIYNKYCTTIFFMEENLEPNTEIIKEITDKSNKPNSEGLKESITEKAKNTDENIPNSQNDSAPKVDLKKEKETPR